jgi:hypothetical protein
MESATWSFGGTLDWWVKSAGSGGAGYELNNRPRLVLNDRAPAELFGALLTSQNRLCCDVD